MSHVVTATGKRVVVTSQQVRIFDVRAARQVPGWSGASESDVLQIVSGSPAWAAIEEVPDYSGADEGDVLTISSSVPAWAAPSSGGGGNLQVVGGVDLDATLRVIEDINSNASKLLLSTASVKIDCELIIGSNTGIKEHDLGSEYGLLITDGAGNAELAICDQIMVGGIGGPRVKISGGLFDFRNNADSGYADIRGSYIRGQSGVLTNVINTLGGNLNMMPIVNFTATMGNSTKNPTSDAPADWVEIQIGGSTYYLPAYAA